MDIMAQSEKPVENLYQTHTNTVIKYTPKLKRECASDTSSFS